MMRFCQEQMSVLGITIFLIVISSTLSAQVISIIDASNKEPLNHVLLSSQEPLIYAESNARGQVDIGAFEGQELIEIRALGFRTISKSYVELAAVELIELDQNAFDIDEVVVSASKSYQSSIYVPSKVSIITQEEIYFENPQTAADLLASSGTVYIQKSQQGGGSPMIRGFATNRLLYSIDGVRMNTAIFRGGNIQNVINLDPFAVERTEVLFGPSSVIYGSDAIGGVMSFQTSKPQLSYSGTPYFGGNAMLRYSSANKEKTGHFDFNIGWKKWSILTSASLWDYDDLKQGNHGPTDYLKTTFVERIDGVDQVIEQEDRLLQLPSAYQQKNVMQKVRFKPNEAWDFNYGFHYSETTSFGRYDRHLRTRNDGPRYAQWDYGPQSWLMNNLSAQNTKPNAVYDLLTIRLAQQKFEESRISRNFNSDLRQIQEEKVDTYSVNLDMTKSLGKKNHLYYGAEWVLNQVESKGLIENIESGEQESSQARYPQADWTSIGLYAKNKIELSEKSKFEAGLRYNYYQLKADFDTRFIPLPFTHANVSDGSLTGSIGFIYQPEKSWILSANIGTAFRAPNVDDIGKVFDSEPGALTIPNPDLEAEYAYNLDIDLRKTFSDKFEFELAAFFIYLDNALVRRNFQLNGIDSIFFDGELSQVQAIQNLSYSRVYGFQAEIEYFIMPYLRLTSTVNYQKGREELDNGEESPSRHAAPLFGSTRLKYKKNKLTLEAYANYQAEVSYDDLAIEERNKSEIYAKDANGNNSSPSWYTLNLKSQYQLTELLSVSLGIENMTDQRYRPYSSGISAAGFNFISSIRLQF